MEKTHLLVRAITASGFDLLVRDFYKNGGTWENAFYQANELYYEFYGVDRYNSYESWKSVKSREAHQKNVNIVYQKGKPPVVHLQKNEKMNHSIISELSAGELNTLELIIEDYTNSRVVEVARRLRQLQVYPVGAQRVSYKQAALLLYLLSAIDRGAERAVQLLDKEPLKDQSGETFIHAFAEILQGKTSLQNILEVFISANVCEIRTTETVRTFGNGAKGEGFTFRKDKLYYYRHFLVNGKDRPGASEQTQRIKQNWLNIEPTFTFPANLNPDDDKAIDLQKVKDWEKPGVIDNYINNLKTN